MLDFLRDFDTCLQEFSALATRLRSQPASAPPLVTPLHATAFYVSSAFLVSAVRSSSVKTSLELQKVVGEYVMTMAVQSENTCIGMPSVRIAV